MKRIIILLVVILSGVAGFSQVPEKMSYQAVIRDNNGNLVTNKSIGIKISILKGSASGTAVYTETNNQSTNENGLLSLEIGGGVAVTGNFSAINWADGTYFIKTETDPSGGTNYSITGTSQILSVPFSFYAKKAATAEDGVKVTGDQSISGTKTFTGTIDAASHNIINVANPVNDQDVATKSYVDDIKDQIDVLKNTIKAGGFVTDIDGNTYSTVKIGTRIWMAENLKVTRFNDGTELHYMSDQSTAVDGWHAPAYCWYNFDSMNKEIYGALYTSGVLITMGKNICPVGWHHSDSPDWLDMLRTLDPLASKDFAHVSQTAGGGLKSTGNVEAGNGYWHAPNIGATNVSGFRALPGGTFNGTFKGIGIGTSFWLGLEYRTLSYISTAIGGSETDSGSRSVRCVKDL
jgi:uncharacterized protein (TIGR02145 family)